MFIVVFWMIMGFVGLAIAIVGAFLGGTFGIMFTMFGCVIEIMPILQVSSAIKEKRLIPFFMKLKDFEQISLFVNNRFQVFPFIFNNKHEGILQKKNIGMIDDKGTPLTWGKLPCSISMQGSGLTIDLKMGHYMALLKNEDGIDDYEEAIRRYLGPMKYKEFFNRFRKNPKPDIVAIRKELQYLINEREPNDFLEKGVIGETIDFKNFCSFMVYAYHPQSSQNAMDAEKIQVKREAMAYATTDKVGSLGKTVVWILIGLMIFFVVMNATGGLKFLGL